MSTEQLVEFEDVTICMAGEFFGNIQATHCKSLSLRVGKYAQYDDACHIRLRKPRQRKDRGLVKTHGRVIVVKGNQVAKLNQASMTESRPSSVPGVTFTQSLYSSFSDNWASDWDKQLAESGCEPIYEWKKK